MKSFKRTKKGSPKTRSLKRSTNKSKRSQTIKRSRKNLKHTKKTLVGGKNLNDVVKYLNDTKNIPDIEKMIDSFIGSVGIDKAKSDNENTTFSFGNISEGYCRRDSEGNPINVNTDLCDLLFINILSFIKKQPSEKSGNSKNYNNTVDNSINKNNSQPTITYNKNLDNFSINLSQTDLQNYDINEAIKKLENYNKTINKQDNNSNANNQQQENRPLKKKIKKKIDVINAFIPHFINYIKEITTNTNNSSQSGGFGIIETVVVAIVAVIVIAGVFQYMGMKAEKKRLKLNDFNYISFNSELMKLVHSELFRLSINLYSDDHIIKKKKDITNFIIGKVIENYISYTNNSNEIFTPKTLNSKLYDALFNVLKSINVKDFTNITEDDLNKVETKFNNYIFIVIKISNLIFTASKKLIDSKKYKNKDIRNYKDCFLKYFEQTIKYIVNLNKTINNQNITIKNFVNFVDSNNNVETIKFIKQKRLKKFINLFIKDSIKKFDYNTSCNNNVSTA